MVKVGFVFKAFFTALALSVFMMIYADFRLSITKYRIYRKSVSSLQGQSNISVDKASPATAHANFDGSDLFLENVTKDSKHYALAPINFCNKSFDLPRRLPGAWTCYRYNGSRCALAACPGDVEPANSYSGFVQQLDPAPGAQPPARSGCKICDWHTRQCAVAPGEQFIYIHVMKAGGSSLTNFLKAALCNCTVGPCRRECTPDLLEFMSCNKALQRHPHFFKWTIARHPFPRAVSAWAMANRQRKEPQTQPPLPKRKAACGIQCIGTVCVLRTAGSATHSSRPAGGCVCGSLR